MGLGVLATDVVQTVSQWVGIAAGLATVFALAPALIAIFYQVRQARFASNIDNLWKLDDKWQAADMLSARKAVASGLVQNKLNGLDDQIHDVLNFFEWVGSLVHKGALDVDGAWNNFSTWAVGYWLALSDCKWIDKNRHDKAVWSEYERLEAELVRLEADKKGWTDDAVRSDYKRDRPEFLARESTLVLITVP
jgi:hypothetical protein